MIITHFRYTYSYTYVLQTKTIEVVMHCQVILSNYECFLQIKDKPNLGNIPVQEWLDASGKVSMTSWRNTSWSSY